MKRISALVIYITLIVSTSHSIYSQNETFSLKWKLNNQIIAYQIKYSDLSKSTPIQIKNLFTKEKTDIVFPEEASMTLLMKQFNENEITVNFFIDKITNINPPSNENNSKEKIIMKDLMNNVTGKIAIIGRIDNNGIITSFWLPDSQRNLLFLFFQLSNGSIKIGDSWNLNMYLINFDPTFKCKDSKKSMKVTFDSIEYDLNKNIIAVLKYNIYEKVKGKSNLGDVDWELSFEGIGKFNITKGEWKSLKLISNTVLKGGYIQADKKQLIELYKLDTIPKQYQVEE